MTEYPGVDWELEMAKIRAAFPRLLESMALITERYALYAKQYRAYFDALVAERFTPEQALEIVKTQGWLPR